MSDFSNTVKQFEFHFNNAVGNRQRCGYLAEMVMVSLAAMKEFSVGLKVEKVTQNDWDDCEVKVGSVIIAQEFVDKAKLGGTRFARQWFVYTFKSVSPETRDEPEDFSEVEIGHFVSLAEAIGEAVAYNVKQHVTDLFESVDEEIMAESYTQLNNQAADEYWFAYGFNAKDGE